MCPYDNIIAYFCIDYICLKVMILARFSTKTAYLNSKNRTLSVKISGSSVFTENVSCIYFESPHTEFK